MCIRDRVSVMSTTFVQAEFRVCIDDDRCQRCGRCVQQCGWGVFSFDERPLPDDAKCRACHRCVTFCPAHAITIEKSPLAFRDNASWQVGLRKSIWRQAETGAVSYTHLTLPTILRV